MPRKTSEPVVDEHGDERHPAFGSAVVLRGSGTGRPLFQSDLLHNETITLQIHTASRKRDLNRDWVHPVHELVEVEMSLAQWGSLVSSIGIGSGVPVTIRRTESEPFVDALPHQPRIAANLEEVRSVVHRLLGEVREAVEAVEEAVEQKKGVRATREAVRALHLAVANAPANAEFAVKSLDGAAEKVTAQARADIESYILQAARIVQGQQGQASIEAPDQDWIPRAIEAPGHDPQEEQ